MLDPPDGLLHRSRVLLALEAELRCTGDGSRSPRNLRVQRLDDMQNLVVGDVVDLGEEDLRLAQLVRTGLEELYGGPACPLCLRACLFKLGDANSAALRLVLELREALSELLNLRDRTLVQFPCLVRRLLLLLELLLCLLDLLRKAV